MAKKKETKEIIEETPKVVESPRVIERPKMKEEKHSVNPEDNWELKDRTYYLSRGRKPLTATIPSTNIYYFDEEKGYERELKYTSNQRTCFVDEMIGDQRLEHITFMNGFLIVPKNKAVLQKLLSLYHPGKNVQYHEQDNVKIARDEVADIELEIAALNAAQSMDIDMAEAIMRVEMGSKVSKMASKELKRDLLVFAKKNPKLFLDLVNDENVILRNFGIRATEMGILKLSTDQRTFSWGSNDRKLMNVPFDEHPYSALAAWFKTDEGMEIYSNIEKRLK
jgi:hypothetical protein